MIKSKKVTLATALSLSLSLVLTACGSGSAPSSNTAPAPEQKSGGEQPKAEQKAEETVVLKMAHSNNDKHKYHKGMLEVKRLIEEKSNGKFTVEVFPSTLGSDKELIEGLQMGTVDGAIINTAVLASIIPDLAVIDMPFMFKDREHAYRVLDGEVGDEFLQKINEKNIVALSYWENGFKGITNNVRPIKTPEDLKGLKIRTMESRAQLDAFKAWGANPTPMSFSEVYQSMQQGVIDGHFNAPDTVAANKMYEVQKYYSDIPLFYGALVFGFSPATWNKFTEEEKQMMKEIAIESRDFERKLAQEEEKAGVETLKANMEVEENPDVQAFIDTVKPVWKQYEAEFSPGLIDRVAE